MDLNRIRYFTVVAKVGSLTGAAKILRLSAPALSKAMSILESEIGFALFHKEGRGLVLTDRGKQVLPLAEKILSDAEALRSDPHRHMKADSRLRLGTFEVFSTYFLQHLISDDFRDLELELHELVPGELENALAEGRIDVGITYVPIPVPGIELLKVGQLRMAVYGRSPFLEITDLSELPFAVPILPIQAAPTKVNGLDGWPDDKLPRQQKYRVSLMESALQLCRQGLCVAYLPSFIVKLHNQQAPRALQLEEIPVRDLPRSQQDVYLVKRNGTDEDARMKRIARVIRTVCRLSI